MNATVISGILQAVIPAVMSYVVGKGWVPAGSVSDVMAAITAIGAAFWSVQTNKAAAPKK